MNQVIFNKNFQGHVTIISQTGSSKTSCAGLIARKAIDARKNVLWINTDNRIEMLRWRIYGNMSCHQMYNRGRVFMTSFQHRKDVNLFMKEAFRQPNKIDMVIVCDVGISDYFNGGDAIVAAFHSYCFLENVPLVYMVQTPRGDIKSFSLRLLAMSDSAYHLNAEDSNLEFEDFKLFQIKQRQSVKKDIFITDSNEWKML